MIDRDRGYETEKISSTQLGENDHENNIHQVNSHRARRRSKKNPSLLEYPPSSKNSTGKKPNLEIDISDEEGSYEEIPESTKQRYQAMGEDSEQYDSFGDPNFEKLIQNNYYPLKKASIILHVKLIIKEYFL